MEEVREFLQVLGQETLRLLKIHRRLFEALGAQGHQSREVQGPKTFRKHGTAFVEMFHEYVSGGLRTG